MTEVLSQLFSLQDHPVFDRQAMRFIESAQLHDAVATAPVGRAPEAVSSLDFPLTRTPTEPDSFSRSFNRVGDILSFNAHAAAFIKAAGDNDPAGMHTAEQHMFRVFNIPYDHTKKAMHAALIRAAETDADLSILYFITKLRKDPGIYKKDLQPALEAAYITACGRDSVRVVETFLDQADLPPELVAWGRYCAPQNGSTELNIFIPAMQRNPEAGEIYENQMNFIDLAVAGQVELFGEIRRQNGPADGFCLSRGC